MGFFKGLIFKLLMAKKEERIAMGMKALVEAYDEHKDDLAEKVVDALPERYKKTAHPEEIVHFADVLKDCTAVLALAAKPLMVRGKLVSGFVVLKPTLPASVRTKSTSRKAG